MVSDLDKWKEEYKAAYVECFITNNPYPWDQETLDDVVESSIESWVDETEEWKHTTAKDAFREDMTYWTE